MNEYERFGPRFRQITPESAKEDSRNLFEMYRDAIIASPTGEPFFSKPDQARVYSLEVQEVIEEAEAISEMGGAVISVTDAEIINV